MVRNRFSGVKGSCYLTHGAHDYDHAAMRKALRATDRDAVLEGIDDIDADVQLFGPKPTKYRLVITTQVYENYGYRWKPKGGNEYHIPLGESVLHVTGGYLKQLVDQHRHLIEKLAGPDELHGVDERIIDWSIYSDVEKTYEEQMDEEYLDFDDKKYAEELRTYREYGWRAEVADYVNYPNN